MGLQLQIEQVIDNKQTIVHKYSTNTLVFTIDDLERIFSDLMTKFNLKQVFHNMQGIHERDLIHETSTKWETMKIKETGLARMYSNGKTSMIFHSYDVSVKQTTHQKFVDPLIHVISYDQEEAQAISNLSKTILLNSLTEKYLESDDIESREAVAKDIATIRFESEGYWKGIYEGFNNIIDNELILLSGQMINWLDKEAPTRFVDLTRLVEFTNDKSTKKVRQTRKQRKADRISEAIAGA